MKPLYERYDVKVDRSGGSDACWPWTAGMDKDGYGRIWLDKGTVRAHRIALERHLGRPIKPGFCALHACDNPPCCNPIHLFEGTKADNSRDSAAKGRARGVRGAQHHSAKLTEADVREIRRRAHGGELQRTLAEEFGIVQPSVSEIVLRKTWKHVDFDHLHI